jgi:hypothetical protein
VEDHLAAAAAGGPRASLTPRARVDIDEEFQHTKLEFSAVVYAVLEREQKIDVTLKRTGPIDVCTRFRCLYPLALFTLVLSYACLSLSYDSIPHCIANYMIVLHNYSLALDSSSTTLVFLSLSPHSRVLVRMSHGHDRCTQRRESQH